MSYRVLDVCRHVINYSNERDYGLYDEVAHLDSF